MVKYAWIFGRVTLLVEYFEQIGPDEIEGGARVEVRRVERELVPGSAAAVSGFRVLPVTRRRLAGGPVPSPEPARRPADLPLPPELRERRRRRAVVRSGADGRSPRLGVRPGRQPARRHPPRPCTRPRRRRGPGRSRDDPAAGAGRAGVRGSVPRVAWPPSADGRRRSSRQGRTPREPRMTARPLGRSGAVAAGRR